MEKLSPALNIPERPFFQGCEIDESWLLSGYRRNLPHLRIQDATYFVTFRTADSIPKSVAEKWLKERHEWLRAHRIDPAWIKTDPHHMYFEYHAIPVIEREEFERNQRHRFFIELNKCHGDCILSKAPDIIAKALEFFHGQRIWLGDYVVMPNHVHALVQLFPGIKLEEWLYSIKRFTSVEINKIFSPIINRNSENKHLDHTHRSGQIDLNFQKTTSMHRKTQRDERALWRSESFDRIVRNTFELKRIRQYIMNNPSKLKAGTFIFKKMPWLDEFDQTSNNPPPLRITSSPSTKSITNSWSSSN